ncbi:PAAR domain-containing protein [Loktanella agnita]|uniref:PAAR domain-containing protein n=1 Tax=Loktanella agnita TaxID=287097 RepID=UPI003985C5D8
MGQPGAKQGDQIVGTDIHIVMIPAAPSPVPTPLPHPFAGIIDDGLSSDVNIMGMPAAVQGSTASNTPPHIPQGGPFQSPPSNKGEVLMGSGTVMINGKPATRSGDTAMTCNDPSDLPVGTVVAIGTVMIG